MIAHLPAAVRIGGGVEGARPHLRSEGAPGRRDGGGYVRWAATGRGFTSSGPNKDVFWTRV